MKEEWKDIEGYEGKYQISNLGRVKSLNYRNTGREDILTSVPDKYGYLHVNLYKNGKKKHYTVHQLVAEVFILNPNNYEEINHKDENKSNNCVSNLEWCDRKYNMNYGTINKRLSESSKGKNKGSKNGNSSKVLCITTGEPFPTVGKASEYCNLKNSSNISACCRGEQKTAGKHPETGEPLVWKYLDE